MDSHFERFQSEVEFTKRCVGSWIDDLCTSKKRNEFVGEALYYFFRNPYFYFEAERYCGVFSMMLEGIPEAPQWRMWRYELYQRLGEERNDRRYFELAFDDCPIDHYLTRGDILVRLGRFQEALDILRREEAKFGMTHVFAYIGLCDGTSLIEQTTAAIERTPKTSLVHLHALAQRGRGFELNGDLDRRDHDWDLLQTAAKEHRLDYEDNWLDRVLITHLSNRNYRAVLDLLESKRSLLTLGSMLGYKSSALHGLAVETFDDQLVEMSDDCLFEAVRLMPDDMHAWVRLFNRLRSQWRYSEAIELSRARPKQDKAGVLKLGRRQTTVSLHELMDSHLPYWQAREAALNEDYMKAMEYLRKSNSCENSQMELANAAGRLADVEQMHFLLESLVEKDWRYGSFKQLVNSNER